jgi:hypothetical protein
MHKKSIYLRVGLNIPGGDDEITEYISGDIYTTTVYAHRAVCRADWKECHHLVQSILNDVRKDLSEQRTGNMIDTSPDRDFGGSTIAGHRVTCGWQESSTPTSRVQDLLQPAGRILGDLQMEVCMGKKRVHLLWCYRPYQQSYRSVGGRDTHSRGRRKEIDLQIRRVFGWDLEMQPICPNHTLTKYEHPCS